MTVHTTTAPARPLLASIYGHLRKIGALIANQSELMRCSREAERLFAMSDDQLARLGLTRDRIVHHAFGRYLAN